MFELPAKFIIQKLGENAPGRMAVDFQQFFIIEAIATVVSDILAIFYLCDFPETAKFLSTRERHIAVARVRIDESKRAYVHPTIREYLEMILDWKLAV